MTGQGPEIHMSDPVHCPECRTCLKCFLCSLDPAGQAPLAGSLSGLLVDPHTPISLPGDSSVPKLSTAGYWPPSISFQGALGDLLFDGLLD